MNKNSKIFIAGHNGLVGSAVYRLLKSKGFKNRNCLKSPHYNWWVLKELVEILGYKHKSSLFVK